MSPENGLTRQVIANRLEGDGLVIHIGPYIYQLQSNIPSVIEGISSLYSDFPLADEGEFIDFQVAIRCDGLMNRLKNQAVFYFDHKQPFSPSSTQHAYASLEWGMNWCVSVYPNEYLKLHAAVVAKDGLAVIMPGVPGAGKSTFCVALGLSGWQVLSDEHALVPLGSASVVPLCRPVSLKNESIEIIRAFDTHAVFGPLCKDTHKGRVAHVKADLHPQSHDTTNLPTQLMLFPRYSATEPQQLTPRSHTQSFVLAAYHSFNYSLLGKVGFDAMSKLIDSVQCFDLIYKDLDWAIHTLNELHRDASTR